MTPAIPVPAKGQPMRASWAAAVTNGVNALGAAGVAGMLVRDGAGGQGFAPLPTNKRTRSAYTPPPSCWNIITAEEEGGETVKVFANQYFQIGGTVYVDDTTYALSDFVMQGELEEGEEYTADDKPFVALKVDMSPTGYGTSEVVGYADIDEMIEDSKLVSYYIKPLYKLTHSGGVAIDFRNMPQIAAGEMDEEGYS